MTSIQICVEEPFTAEEARDILQIGLQSYDEALAVGTLHASGVIRLTLPCRAPHHTFWDLFRYCILAEFVARLASSPTMQSRVDELLDEVAHLSEESALSHCLLRGCLLRFDQYCSDDGRQRTDIYSDMLERAVMAGFKRVNAALTRVFAFSAPLPSRSESSALASVISERERVFSDMRSA